MAVEFLDEAPPAGKTAGGFEFIDETPAGVEFVGDKVLPPEAPDVAKRLQDPAYMPTLAEYQAWSKGEKEKPWFRPGDWAETAGNAASGIADIVTKGVKAMFKGDKPEDPNTSGLQTVLEAGARGFVNDLMMGKKSVEHLTGLLAPGTGLNFDQFVAVKLAQENWKAFPKGFDTHATLLTTSDVPAKTMAEWKKEYEEKFNPDQEYKGFLQHRTDQLEEIQRRDAQAQGQKNLLPEVFGKPNNDLSEALSLVESPVSLATLGGGAEAKAAATGLQRAAAVGARGTGKVLSTVGRIGEAVAALPAKVVSKGFEWMADSAEAGEAAANAATKAPGVGVLSKLKLMAKPVTATGEALEAAGRAIEVGPSRTGLLGTIATDGAAPKWIRAAAAAGKVLDPAIELAGGAVESAVHGAGMGAGLGWLSEGNEEGVFGGLGSGAALGAGFGTVGRIVGARAQLEAKRQGDLTRWFLSKSPEEQANIHAMNLSSDDALKFATLEQVARGMRGEQGEGDLKFVYTDDKTFKKAFGGSAKGAEFVQGDTPTVVINVDRGDAGTLPHEVFHGLMDLAVGDEAKADLNRRLFTQTAPDGTVLTEGAFSAADMTRAEDQYVSRLHEAGKAEWATLTPEQRQAKIRGELAADAFANLVKSQGTDYLLNGLSGPRRRIVDSLLRAQEGSLLGRMRRGLERAGVKFDSSGAPSELFVKDGKPVTNSPQVDAALRDYLRAKEKVRTRLVADDDAPSATVVTRQDMMSRNAKVIAELYKDNDNFAKDAAGNVKFQGGQPILLSEGQIKKLQMDRTEAMLKQLETVPDNGDSGAVRKKDNGAYEGRYFTNAQLDALDRVIDGLLPQSLKEKLRAINEFHRTGDGSRFVLDYNAATKESKGGGRIYSSSIKSTLRDVVPISIHISKAGNFYTTGLDTTVLFSKLNRWFKDKPKAFDAWGGDRDAVIRDIFKYLDNHANGRQGSVGLDSGPATAVHKKNVLNDLFGVARGTGANPIELSTKGGKDQLVRSFRFDRTNRVTESGGDKMPFNYPLQKINFLPAPQGREWTATTPTAGVPVKGRYEVHEAGDLVSSFDKGFDPTLQPRDRSRAASVNQIATIVQKFEPQRLGEAPTTDMGAPVIDDQRQVLSGNGRTASLRTIYGATEPGRAQSYKDYLVRNAEQFGLKPADVDAMQQPVLVRRVDDYGGLSKAEFARQSNQSQLLSMSGAEKASADARMLTETPGLLDKFAPSEEGNVLAETNREFLNQFIQATGDSAELLTEKGYNQEALRKRVETAIMATLLGPEHRDLITKLIERSDKFKIRKAVNGLMQSSSKLVKLKGTDYDLGSYLQESLANLIRLRGSGEKVESFLASKTLIGNSDRTAAGDHVLEFLAKAKSMKQVSEDLQRYFVMAQNAIADAQSGGLFGDVPRTREQLVAEIYGKLQRDSAQYPGNQPSPANQPTPQPPTVAATPGPQPAAPGNPVQPASPGPAVTPQPVATAPVTPAVAPTVTRPRPPGAPAFLDRPLPRRPWILPGPGAIRVSPQAVIQHTTAQTITNLADKLAQIGAPMTSNVRQDLATYYVKRLDSSRRQSSPEPRSEIVLDVATMADRVNELDIQAISAALRSQGLTGARKTIDRQAQLKTALAELRTRYPSMASKVASPALS